MTPDPPPPPTLMQNDEFGGQHPADLIAKQIKILQDMPMVSKVGHKLHEPGRVEVAARIQQRGHHIWLHSIQPDYHRAVEALIKEVRKRQRAAQRKK
jgi:hypothetical protein